MKKAVVLLSGGLDSAVALYFAKSRGFRCRCLIFDYGQRHSKEIRSAKRIAQRAGCEWQVVEIALPWKGSVLLNKRIKIPVVTKPQSHKATGEIPSTYVPARNIIFLSFALSCAEATGAEAIFIGAHAQDYSGYPDCRPEFFRAFKRVVAKGTRSGAKHKAVSIFAPLIDKSKSGIIKLGGRLGVPFELTWSCYYGQARPCLRCDSCYFRAKGFREAGIEDPIIKK